MGANSSHLVAYAISSRLRAAERSVDWLSDRTGIDKHALRAKLAGRGDLTIVDLADIAAALGVPVAALTPSERPQGG